MQAIESGFLSWICLHVAHRPAAKPQNKEDLVPSYQPDCSLNIWDMNQEPHGSEITSTKQQVTESTAHEERTGRTERGQEDRRARRQEVKSPELRKRTEAQLENWDNQFCSFRDGETHKRQLKHNRIIYQN